MFKYMYRVHKTSFQKWNMIDATKRKLRKHDSKYGIESTEPMGSVENHVIWSLSYVKVFLNKHIR
jgi:hypothetical protein